MSYPRASVARMVTAEDVRRLAITLPRTEEHLIRDQVKFRVGRIVYIAIAADEKSMGFGFPKEERAALVAAEPEKFFLPAKSDMRYNWVRVWLGAIDEAGLRAVGGEGGALGVRKRV